MNDEITTFERWTRGNSKRHTWTVLAGGCAAHLWVHQHGEGEPYGGIEIHSPTPSYTDHKPRPCHLLEGGQCYHDGTSLGAEKYVRMYAEGELTDECAFMAVRPYLRDAIERSTPTTANPATETEA